jgi:hypothetical protein
MVGGFAVSPVGEVAGASAAGSSAEGEGPIDPFAPVAMGGSRQSPQADLPSFNEFSPHELQVETVPGDAVTHDTAGGSSFHELTGQEIEERSEGFVGPLVGGSPGTGPDGRSFSRAGESYNEYNAAEVALGMRFDHQDGELLSVEFDVPLDPGNLGTREGESFTLDPYLRAIDADQLRSSSLIGLDYERGHAVAQANSEGDEEVAQELMRTSNVWAMRGKEADGVNQGTYKSVETYLTQVANTYPDSIVRVRIEGIRDDPAVFDIGLDGNPILVPKEFVFTVAVDDASESGPRVVRTITVPNQPGAKPIVS